MTSWILLAVVGIQIAAESLPISSSGHVALFLALCKKWGFDTDSSVHRIPIDTVVPLPNILIVAAFFYKEWWSLLTLLVRTLFNINITPATRARASMVIGRLTLYGGTAAALSGVWFIIIRVLLKEVIAQWHQPLLVIGFGVTTFLLLVVLRTVSTKRVSTYQPLTFSSAALIGFVQGIALLPGISRFGSTYVVARWLNIAPRRAFQFSFLIGTAVMVLGFLKDVTQVSAQALAPLLSFDVLSIILGCCILSAWLLKTMYVWALEEKLWRVGFYMPIPLGIALFILFF